MTSRKFFFEILKSKIFAKVYEARQIITPFNHRESLHNSEFISLNLMIQLQFITETSFRTLIVLMTNSLCHNLEMPLHSKSKQASYNGLSMPG